MKKKDMKPPEGKKFYGSITVSERGQIVIPAEARKDFNIDTGDKLLVFGDMQMGIWIATSGILEKYMAGSLEFFRKMEKQVKKTA
jgi:AbrB family looped-hinge helix DNA binding protein